MGRTVQDMFPSKWLSGEDIRQRGGMIKFQIEGLSYEVFGQGKDETMKPVLWFYDEQKGFILNKSNAEVIAMVLNSPDTDNWRDHEITLLSMFRNIGGNQKCVIDVMGGGGPEVQGPTGGAQGNRGGGGRPGPAAGGRPNFAGGGGARAQLQNGGSMRPAPANANGNSSGNGQGPAHHPDDPAFSDFEDPKDGPASDALLKEVGKAYLEMMGGDKDAAKEKYRHDTGGVRPSETRADIMLDVAREAVRVARGKAAALAAPVQAGSRGSIPDQPGHDNFDDSDPFADE